VRWHAFDKRHELLLPAEEEELDMVTREMFYMCKGSRRGYKVVKTWQL